MSGHKWSPITDVPEDTSSVASKEFPALVRVWHEQSERLKESQAYREFLDRLRRQLAIETGIIERLYNIDRGVTQLLIEKGIDEVYIPHGATDRPASEVIAMIRDHESAIEGMFAYIASRTPLTKAYLRELHKVLTAHQLHVEAVNMGSHSHPTHRSFANSADGVMCWDHGSAECQDRMSRMRALARAGGRVGNPIGGGPEDIAHVVQAPIQ